MRGSHCIACPGICPAETISATNAGAQNHTRFASSSDIQCVSSAVPSLYITIMLFGTGSPAAFATVPLSEKETDFPSE